MTLLRLSARNRGHGVVVVELAGEIDLATAPTLRAALERIQTPPPPSGLLVLLDLSRLDFCDAVGLDVMVTSARRLAERGARLALVAPQRHFTRLLAITGLDRYFEVFPTLQAADASPTARHIRYGNSARSVGTFRSA